MASMGVAQNVVPMHSEISVNMRTLPGDMGDLPRSFMLRMLREAGVQVAGEEDRAGGSLVQRAVLALQRSTQQRPVAKAVLHEMPGVHPPSQVRDAHILHTKRW